VAKHEAMNVESLKKYMKLFRGVEGDQSIYVVVADRERFVK
jgi:hypothetical protein